MLHSANSNASTHGRPCANPCGSDAHAGAHRNFATNPYVRTGANSNALAYINAAAYTYANPYSCTATHAYAYAHTNRHRNTDANTDGHPNCNTGAHGYADASADSHTHGYTDPGPAQPDYEFAERLLAGTQRTSAGGTNPEIALDCRWR